MIADSLALITWPEENRPCSAVTLLHSVALLWKTEEENLLIFRLLYARTD
jgi:hypothetical protein